MHVGSNVCRYRIYQETVPEVILHIRRCCLGEVLYMLKCVALNSLKWSFDIIQDFVL